MNGPFFSTEKIKQFFCLLRSSKKKMRKGKEKVKMKEPAATLSPLFFKINSCSSSQPSHSILLISIKGKIFFFIIHNFPLHLTLVSC